MSAVASSAGGGAARAFWFLPRERFFLSAAISATFRTKFNTFSSSATPLLKPFSFPLLAAGGSSTVDADTDVKSSSSSREIGRKQNNSKKTKNVVSRKEVQQQLQLQWLLSLSPARAQTGDSESETEAEVEADPEVADLPLDMPGFPEIMPVPSVSGRSGNGNSNAWVLGIDPDTHGAIALLKPSLNGSSSEAQVYDAPTVKYMVGKRFRRRLDTRSIVSLMQSLGAPAGSMAYIEQATPIPCDGRLGWWSSGFSYGLWIGILVASGFSVIPIPSIVWKKYFDLPGGRSTKDVSRATACNLFPSLSPQLKRKKDHGRAEALLIATYGSMIWKQR